MARRHTAPALAAIIVIARLLGGGSATASTDRDPQIQAELSNHRVPSRSLRGFHGAVRTVRSAMPGPWLATATVVVEEPPRTLAPPAVRPLVAPIADPPPPTAGARAPPG